MELFSEKEPTREILLSLIDDMELISREILENLTAPKQKRMPSAEHEELIKLLVEKDATLKKALKVAEEQEEIQRKIESVREEYEKENENVQELYNQLKEAETLLSTSIFQAKLKLDAIEKASESPVSSEELIKYAHRISASNAVCAPLNWQQGDPRRPYPTDIEMRGGYLAKTESQIQQAEQQHRLASRPPPPVAPSGGAGGGSYHHPSPFASHQSPSKTPLGAGSSNLPPPPHHSTFSWQGGEVGLTGKDGHLALPGGAGGGHGGDVDVMSTDSSSSSSTDSN